MVWIHGGAYIQGGTSDTVYEGTNIASGMKSIAISIVYRKEDGTLTDKEVSDAEEKIKFELTKVYKAELRG